MTSKEDTEARDMYYEAMEALERHLVRKAGPLTYLSDLKNGRPDSRMQHLVRGGGVRGGGVRPGSDVLCVVVVEVEGIATVEAGDSEYIVCVLVDHC